MKHKLELSDSNNKRFKLFSDMDELRFKFLDMDLNLKPRICVELCDYISEFCELKEKINIKILNKECNNYINIKKIDRP